MRGKCEKKRSQEVCKAFLAKQLDRRGHQPREQGQLGEAGLQGKLGALVVTLNLRVEKQPETQL